MARNKFEFTDGSESQTNLTMGSGKQGKGCYVSLVLGFVLVLLAAAIAVGVGIIVHFAGGNREVVCNCQVSPVSGNPSAEAIKQECMNMASQGNAAICQKCPVASTPSILGTTAVTPTEKPKVTDVRLPKSVYPLHYDVELQPYMYGGDPSKFTFKGSVRILVRCDVATDNVTLHAKVLTVDSSTIQFNPEAARTATDPKFTSSSIDKDREFFIVKLDKNMEVGKNYTVEMKFSSPLTNDLGGLYYSVYTRGNQSVYLATTQFQPTDARKAFPCFDEPAIKATFNITLVRPDYLISISNMPIIDSSQNFKEGAITFVKDVYQITPKMSTYLLAFIISDFNYTMNNTKNGVLYRAWATPESRDQTYYALDVGVNVIEYYEDYFEVKYPLPKQDMIAIPDFAAGAMENWGLITYRETAMLYKEGVSSEANKEYVCFVVAHELAHQWFGNLVTPSWWDDLWLNEGFASYVEHIGVDRVHPEWNMFDKFVVRRVQNSFDFDGLVSSHPLYVPVGHPDQINEIFDSISYDKGASVIRMMQHFLGEDTFRKGLKRYLTKLAYGAAFHNDLWAALTEQAESEGRNLNVTAIMHTWVLQMNYPVVMVKREANSQNKLSVTQDRYLSDPTAPDPGKYVSPFGYRWTIPLTFTSSNNPNFNKNHTDVFWMYSSQSTMSIDLPQALPTTPDGWILANTQQHGYYRVNYEPSNWKTLSDQLKTDHKVIPVSNRAQIINDAWNLAKANFTTLEVALGTIDYLEKEMDYFPWYAAQKELTFVDKMLAFNSLYGAFQRFMLKKVNSTFSQFGLENIQQGHNNVAMQALIASQACYYGSQQCLDSVSAQFKKWMDNPSNNLINPDLKNVVYCYAIRNGGWAEWQFALGMYKTINVASEKDNLLSALACSKQFWILNHFMNIILIENSPIRKQDALRVISNVARTTAGRYLAWNFLRSNYQTLKSQFGSSFFAWANVIRAVAESFNTEFELKEVTAFKESQSGNLGSAERAFEQAVEKVAGNIKWMNRSLPVLTNFLSGY